MAYKFGVDEPLGAAIGRCAREQLDRAVGELTDGINRDPVKAVHNARKAIKKERSLLRLVRGAMPASERQRENDALRDVARGLSSARDADVMVATLAGLADRFAGQVPASTFEKLRGYMRSGSVSHAGARSGWNARVVEEVEATRLRLGEWDVRGEGWDAIESGLRRSYRRGRRAFARARANPSSEDLHAWRKRIKDLWYQERLLAPPCGPVVRGQAKDAHRVADPLGDDHDLALLRQWLTRDATPVPVDVEAVIKLIDHRRTELQTEAFQLGGRIYAESPKAFIRRMRRSWTAGRTAAKLEERPAELAAATREPVPS